MAEKKKASKKVVVAKGVKVKPKTLKKMKEKDGSSNAGEYKNVSPREFAGSSGGASKYSYPVDSLKRARSALKLAHNAPNPAGIKAAVYKRFPQLKPSKKKKVNKK